MTLLIYYIVLMLLGDALAVVLGLWIEKYWPAASLPIFLALYFGLLWVAWILAVRLTEPKAAPAATAAQRDQLAE
jgi:hypothetical protein